MSQKNALEIFRQRAKKNPSLEAAYIEEKKKYHIACKIRECRIRKKLTQKGLATLIGTTQSVISRLENAEYTSHSLNILKKISEATNEPLDSFLKEEDNQAKDQKVIKHHIPQVMKKYTSFCRWTSTQVLSKRLHA